MIEAGAPPKDAPARMVSLALAWLRLVDSGVHGNHECTHHHVARPLLCHTVPNSEDLEVEPAELVED
jgi:hypothetical protein